MKEDSNKFEVRFLWEAPAYMPRKRGIGSKGFNGRRATFRLETDLCQTTNGSHCSDDKEAACDMGDLGLIPGLGRFPRERNDHPLQYSCLENSMDRGAWQATVYGVAKN